MNSGPLNRENIRRDATADKAVVKKNVGHLTRLYSKAARAGIGQGEHGVVAMITTPTESIRARLRRSLDLRGMV